jgi:hypothetical protein
MIYTIGHEATYMKALADKPEGGLMKLGARPPGEQYPKGYQGGYAFQSVYDALRRINEAHEGQGFAVFGLETTWDNTRQSESGWWSHLIQDARIIPLERNRLAAPETMEAVA